jgi:hypothetical protein
MFSEIIYLDYQLADKDRFFSFILPNPSAMLQGQPGRNLFIGPREFVSFSGGAGWR